MGVQPIDEFGKRKLSMSIRELEYTFIDIRRISRLSNTELNTGLIVWYKRRKLGGGMRMSRIYRKT